MKLTSLVISAAGAMAVGGMGLAASWRSRPALVDELAQAARDAAGGDGFTLANGWLTRYPVLSGGEGLPGEVRARAASAIAAVPGVAGVSWRAVRRGGGVAGSNLPVANVALHCQDDFEAVLKVRTIRFAEASAQIDAASEKVLDEVAAALPPCLGAIIAVSGHTDSNGDETANRALSRARVDAVQWALIGRGISADGLRSEGVGSDRPLEGLAREDPANRRIESRVLEKAPIAPTPIDTPGPV